MPIAWPSCLASRWRSRPTASREARRFVRLVLLGNCSSIPRRRKNYAAFAKELAALATLYVNVRSAGRPRARVCRGYQPFHTPAARDC